MTARPSLPAPQRKQWPRLRHVRPFRTTPRDTVPGLIHRLILETTKLLGKTRAR